MLRKLENPSDCTAKQYSVVMQTHLVRLYAVADHKIETDLNLSCRKKQAMLSLSCRKKQAVLSLSCRKKNKQCSLFLSGLHFHYTRLISLLFSCSSRAVACLRNYSKKQYAWLECFFIVRPTSEGK